MKRLISLLVVFAMAFGMVAVLPEVVEPEEAHAVSTSQYESWEAAGNAAVNGVDYRVIENNYGIFTPLGLAWFSNQVNSGNDFSGKTVYLGADIYMGGAGSSIAGGSFNPIGYNGHAPFRGTFNGRGYNIGSLYSNSSSAASVGLFGQTYDAVIENVTIDNGEFRSDSTGGYAGTIVGYAVNTKIYNCGAQNGDVYGYYAGGIAGEVNNSSIVNCYSTAGVYAMEFYEPGGISYGAYASNIINSYFGGYIGYMYNDDGSRPENAITGSQGNYSTCYYLGNGSNVNLNGATKPSNAYAVHSNLNSWINSNKSTYPMARYWRTRSGINNYYATLDAYYDSWADAGNQAVSGIDYGGISGGYGGYQIFTAEGLAWMANQINSGGSGLVNPSFTLNRDIDLTGSIANVYESDIAGGSWNPIGSSSNPFKGSFDGQGHTVSGIYYSGTGSDGGLFGTVNSSGYIRNVGISNVSVSGYGSNFGALAGYVTGGCKVYNCYNSSDISAVSFTYVGGLIGSSVNSGGSATASNKVYNCYNTGNISGNQHACGIIGESTGSYESIDNCWNSGKITVSSGSSYPIASGSAGIYRCYSLSGTTSGSNSGVTAMTADDMKSDNFGNRLRAYVVNERISSLPLSNWYSSSLEYPSLSFSTDAISLTYCDIELSATSFEYTGSNIEPVSLELGGFAVNATSNSNYDISYSNNKNVGTATAVITGKNNLKGSVTKTFTITPRFATLAWSGNATREYDGKASNVTATVSNLASGDTCAVLVSNGTQKNSGSYTATATSLSNNNYQLQTNVPGKSMNYTITPRTATLNWSGYETRPYDGKASNVTAAVGNLVSGDTCNVTVTGGTESSVNTHTATATGLTGASSGNYTLPANKTKQYIINPGDMNLNVTGYGGTYDGQFHGITITGAPSGSTIYYGKTQAEAESHKSSTPITYKDAGTYTVYYSVVKDNYTTNNGNTKIIIEPKIIEAITWSGLETREYDGKPSNVTAVPSVGNLISGDVCNITVTGGTEKNAGSWTATPTGVTNSNYELGPRMLSQDYTINPKVVGLTWSGNETRVYDGKASNVTAAATGLISGDTCTVTVSGGTESAAATHTATATKLSNSNYALPAEPKTTYTILGVMNPTITPYVGIYNGQNHGITISNAPAGATIKYGETASSCNSLTPIAYKDVTASLSGGVKKVYFTIDAPGYDTYSGSSTITITPKTVGLTWSGNNERTYDGTASNVTATATGIETGDSCLVTVTGGTERNANTWTATATSLSNGNYQLPASDAAKQTKYTISKRPATLTWAGNARRTYDGSASNVTATVANLVSGDTCSVTVADGTQKNAGSWTATATDLTGASKDNYMLTSAKTCPYTIDKRTAALTWSGNAAREYDGKTSNVTAAVSNLVSGDSCTVTVSNGAQKDAGTYKAAASALSNSNYQLSANAADKEASYTITPRTATLAWSGNASREYDGKASNVTAAVSNLVSGDSCTVTVTNGAQKDAGTYKAAASALSNGNYQLPANSADKEASYIITPRTAALTWAGNAAREYDGKASNVTATVSNAVTGDTCTVPVTGGTQKDAGTWTATAGNLSNPNYKLPDNSTTTYTITKRVIKLKWAGNETRVYNGLPSNVTATVDNLVSGDVCTLSVTGGNQVNVGTWTATAGSPSNTNYALPNNPTTPYTITKADMKPVISGFEGVYDGQSHGAAVAGVPSGAAVTYGTVEGTYNLAASPTYRDVCDVTVYVKVTAANYNDYEGSAKVKITPKTAIFTWNGYETRTYDGKPSNVTAAVGNVTPGDVCAATVTGGTESAAGDHTAEVTALSNTNYAMPANAADKQKKYTINKAGVIPNVTGFEGTYDGNEHTITVKDVPSGAEIKYGTAKEDCKLTEPPKYKNAGTYEIFYETTNANYEKVNGSAKVIISKKTVGLIWHGNEERIYDGNPSNVRAEATGLIDGDECSVTVENGTQTTTGIHTATATGLSNNNYTLSESCSAKYTIRNRTMEPKIISYSGVYDGQGHGITVEPGSIPADAKVYYKLSTDSVDKYSTNNVLLTDVTNGKATINYEIRGAAYYNTYQGSATIEITPKTATLTWSGTTDRVYDGLASNVTAAVNNLEDGDECAVTVENGNQINVGTYKATAKALSNGNYVLSEIEAEKTASYTISNAAINEKVENYKGTYDGAAHGININDIPSGAVIKYGDGSKKESEKVVCDKASLTYTAAGNYTVYYEITAPNYTTKPGSGTVTIDKRTAELTWSGNADRVYDGTASNVTANVNNLIAGDACVVTVENGNQINASETPYTATATALSNTNYSLPENPTTAYKITNAAMAPVVKDYKGIYDGQSHSIEISNLPDGAELVYGETTDYEKGENLPTYTNVGEYKVYFKITAPNYNDFEGSGNVTITNADMSASVLVSVPNPKAYDGNSSYITITAPSDAEILYSKEAAYVEGEENTSFSSMNPEFTEAGEHIVYYVVTRPNYATVKGSRTVVINPKTIEYVTSGSIEMQTYTGEEVKPEFTLTDTAIIVNGQPKGLIEGEDYTVGYEDNINPGTAYIVVAGKGNYSAETVKRIPFTIDKAPQETLTAAASEQYQAIGETVTLSTTGGSGDGAVTYAIADGSTGAGTIEGNILTITAAGAINITATKAESASYFETASEAITVIGCENPDMPENVSVSGVSGESVNVSFTPPTVLGNAPSILKYTVYVYDAEGETVKSVEKNAEAGPKPENETVEVLVEGLSKGTDYTFKVTAASYVNDSVSLESAQTDGTAFKTWHDPSAARMISFAATGVSGEIKAMWSPPSDKGGTVMTRYHIEYRTKGSSDAWTRETHDAEFEITGFEKSSYEHIISGLEDSKAYEFRIIPENGSGTTAEDTLNIYTVQSNAVASSPIIGAAVPGDNSVKLEYIRVANNGGSVIKSYHIYAAEVSGENDVPRDDEYKPVMTIAASASNDRELKNVLITSDSNSGISIVNNKQYMIKVKAENSLGISGYSNAEYVYVGMPAMPEMFMAESTNDLKINVRWVNSGGGMAPSGYEIMTDNSQTFTIDDADATNYVLDNEYYSMQEVSVKMRAFAQSEDGTKLYSTWTNEITVTIGAPTTPEITKYDIYGKSGDITGVDLAWSEANFNRSKPKGYNVYLNQVDESGKTMGEEKVISVNSSVLTYNITGDSFEYGSRYMIEVDAENAAGSKSARSNAVAFVFGISQTPKNVSASAGNGSVKLTWEKPDSYGYDISEYRVYIDGSYAASVSGDVLEYEQTSGIVNGREYSLQVSAVNLYGESALSAVQKCKPKTTASAPINVKAEPASASSITLRWGEPGLLGGSAVTEYRICGWEADENGNINEQAKVAESCFTTDKITGLSTTVTGLSKGTYYVFEVWAVNGAGESTDRSRSNAARTFTNPDAPVLTEVSSSTAAGSTKKITLKWQEPKNTGGTEIAYYNIYTKVEDTLTLQAERISADAREYVIENNNFVEGRTITFTMKAAIDGDLMSAEAEPKTVTVGSPKPPRNFTAENDIVDGNVVINLSWDVSHLSDENIAGYYIKCKPQNGSVERSVKIEGRDTISYVLNPSDIGLGVSDKLDISIASYTINTSTLKTIIGTYVEARTITVGAPKAPRTKAQAGFESMTVRVPDITTDETNGVEITRYYVYLDGEKIGYVQDTGAQNGFEYTLRGIPSAEGADIKLSDLTDVKPFEFGHEYSVSVALAGQYGSPEGTRSMEVKVTPWTNPDSPEMSNIIGMNGAFTFNFKAPSGNGLDVYGYKLYLDGAEYSDFSISGGKVTVNNIENAVEHEFYLAAVTHDTSGNEYESSEPDVWNTVVAGRPSAPKVTSIIPNDGYTDIEWTVASNGGSAIDYYTVRYAGSKDTVTGTTARISAENGERIDVYISAHNGLDLTSEETHLTVMAGIPRKPVINETLPGDGKVKVTWGEVDPICGSIDKYFVYVYDADGNQVRKEESPDISFDVSGLENGERYTFMVSAKNTELDYESEKSEGISEIPGSVPGEVSELTARCSADGSITLSWKAPSESGGLTVTEYAVSMDGEPIEVNVSETEIGYECEIAGIGRGKTHTFGVAAVNKVGTGNEAQTDGTTWDVPGAPAADTLSSSGGAITLEIKETAESKNGGSAVKGYYVYVSKPDSNEFYPLPVNEEMIAPINNPGGLIKYTFNAARVENADGNIEEVRFNGGAKYYVKVCAVNGLYDEANPRPEDMGIFSQASGVYITGQAVITNPGAPRDVTAEAGNGKVTVNWKKPTNLGGSSGLFEYIIFYKQPGGSEKSVHVQEGLENDELTYTIDGLTNGIEYTIYMRAYNKEGYESANSSVVTATPAELKVEAPSWPAYNAGTVDESGNITADTSSAYISNEAGTQITLNWNAPATDGVTYIVEINGAEYTADSTSYVLSGVTSVDTEHKIRVAAVLGEARSAWSAVLTAKSGLNIYKPIASGTILQNEDSDYDGKIDSVVTVPETVQNFAAEGGQGKAMLKWNAPGNNGGAAIDYYLITKTHDNVSEEITVNVEADGTPVYNADITSEMLSGNAEDGYVLNVTLDAGLYKFKIAVHNSAGLGTATGEKLIRVTEINPDITPAPDATEAPTLNPDATPDPDATEEPTFDPDATANPDETPVPDVTPNPTEDIPTAAGAPVITHVYSNGADRVKLYWNAPEKLSGEIGEIYGYIIYVDGEEYAKVTAEESATSYGNYGYLFENADTLGDMPKITVNSYKEYEGVKIEGLISNEWTLNINLNVPADPDIVGNDDNPDIWENGMDEGTSDKDGNGTIDTSKTAKVIGTVNASGKEAKVEVLNGYDEVVANTSTANEFELEITLGNASDSARAVSETYTVKITRNGATSYTVTDIPLSDIETFKVDAILYLGDADNNGVIDQVDLNMYKRNKDKTVIPGTNADVDGSGKVDQVDKTYITRNFLKRASAISYSELAQ